MDVVRDAEGLQRAQELFSQSFASLLHESRRTSLGYQGGNFETEVMWVPSLGIWGYFGVPPNEKSPGERFWNPFGLGEPASQASIVCEINPPLRGVNPATGGVFLRGSSGELIVAHRGRFTVTGGMSSKHFLDNYRGDKIPPPDGQTKPVLAKVAQLQSASFGSDIARFIREVHSIKEAKREANKHRKGK